MTPLERKITAVRILRSFPIRPFGTRMKRPDHFHANQSVGSLLFRVMNFVAPSGTFGFERVHFEGGMVIARFFVSGSWGDRK